MKWLLYAWRNVVRNGRRSLMAGGVVAIGAVALATTLGFMLATFFGLGESTIRADVGHIQIAAPGGFENDTDIGHGLDGATQERVFQVLGRTEGVRFAMRRILFDGLAAKGNTTVAVVGRGVEAMQEQRLSTVFAPVTAGTALGLKEEDRFEALIGKLMASKLGWRPDDLLILVGTTASGSINAVDVVGTGAYSTGVPDKDARAVMVPLSVAKSLLDTDKVSRIVVVLQDTAMTDTVLAQLKQALPELDIRDWKALDPYYQQVVTLYRNIFSILCAIIVVVVLLSISNTMMMTVFERIKEIGTTRAIGFSAGEIRASFALEGTIIGILGALIGLALAAALAVVINLSGIQMPPAPGRTAPYPLVIFIEPAVYLGIAAAMVVCGLLGALVPAHGASRMPIVEALGHE